MKRPRTTKVSPKTSAAQIVAAIDDLLVQVFVRIPLKQVNRLKLVSKHWNSIISDPKLHLSLRNPEPASGLIFNLRSKSLYDLHNPYESYFLYFDQPTIPKPIAGKVVVVHSCNGLLLLKSIFDYRRHHIYNPMTNKSSTLDPGTGQEYFPSSVLGMYLAFDPSESCHYKLVCVVALGKHSWSRPRSPDPFKFEVYSSETDSWRRCGELFSATVDFEQGVYWKGAIHWVSLKKSGQSIYFNPCGDDRMLPTVMPSPPILEDAKGRTRHYGEKRSHWYEGRNYHFGESCGHLNFIDAYSSKVFDGFNVYEMKTDYSEWFVKFRVDLSNVFVERCSFCICTLVRGNKDDGTFLVFRVGKKFMRCNLVDKTCETILDCECIDTRFDKRLLSHETRFDKGLLGYGGEFPLQYIEGAYGDLDGVWYAEKEISSDSGSSSSSILSSSSSDYGSSSSDFVSDSSSANGSDAEAIEFD